MLLSLAAECYFGLDRIGTRIWELIGEHGRLDAVLKAVVAEFDVDEATARRDLVHLVGQLMEKGLVHVEPQQG